MSGVVGKLGVLLRGLRGGRAHVIWDFPRLAAGEALLEGAYTPEALRGQHIMSAASAQIAELGAGRGARWVIRFVTANNIPSLKGCQRAGFVPYLLRKETWRWFRRRLTFTPLPDGTPSPTTLCRPTVRPSPPALRPEPGGAVYRISPFRYTDCNLGV